MGGGGKRQALYGAAMLLFFPSPAQPFRQLSPNPPCLQTKGQKQDLLVMGETRPFEAWIQLNQLLCKMIHWFKCWKHHMLAPPTGQNT